MDSLLVSFLLNFKLPIFPRLTNNLSTGKHFKNIFLTNKSQQIKTYTQIHRIYYYHYLFINLYEVRMYERKFEERIVRGKSRSGSRESITSSK